MGRLRYGMITSLDGYVADAEGDFSWAAPDAEVHSHVNDLERTVGTYLYGRRMYEVMSYWADPPGQSSPTEPAALPHPEQDYARIWQNADKVVFSTTLAEVTTPRTRLERVFDTAQVRAVVEQSPSDVTIAGPGLAAHAMRAGLVHEVHLYVCPVIVGAGGRAWAPPDVRVDLRLRETHRFSGGTVYLRYDTQR